MSHPRIVLSLDEIRELESIYYEMAKVFQSHSETVLSVGERARKAGMDYTQPHERATETLAAIILHAADNLAKTLPGVQAVARLAKNELPAGLEPGYVKHSVQALFRDIRNEL